MNAFIIRPFGVKRDVDFDAVERELIAPALSRLDVAGRTTADIARAGNIRTDMFQLLITADIVVADISIHNANVFYELGVRHGLRDKRTFLIRAGIDDVPFDLRTDRYVVYDPKAPGRSLDALVAGLAATMRDDVVDSPVYGLLPALAPPDPASLIVVPADFQEEVRTARAGRHGGDLRFLASELDGLRWKRDGRRLIGDAQFDIRDLQYAAETWESVRAEVNADVHANLRLGTIYQKRGDLVRSDAALERVLAIETLASEARAEAHALRGSNAKTRWLEEWRAAEPAARQAAALRSPHLRHAIGEYTSGFEADPRHFYSGLNALALNVALTELAAAQPAVWAARFEDDDEARVELKKCTRLRAQLAGAVEFSLMSSRQRLARAGTSDPWLDVSFADLAFLLGRSNLQQLYGDALARLGAFAVSSAGRQVDIFEQLQILPASVAGAASLFAARREDAAPAARPPRVLLFTGHRVDPPGRQPPRFPARHEPAARAAIRSAVKDALGAAPEGGIAIAGGASGGDVLFLEACEELGVERHLYLIIPRDDYVRESVAPSGGDWVQRFNHQFETAACRVYQRSTALPGWLQDKPRYSIWERSNLWMLHNALWLGGAHTTVVALWDGEDGDGPGGTTHMVDAARGRGAPVVVLDTTTLFDLGRARE